MKAHFSRWMVAGECMLAAISAQATFIDHHFDAAPFTNGATLVTAVEQWRASDAGVMVVNTRYASPSNSVLVPSGSTLTNAVDVPTPGVVWADYRITPFLGVAPDLSATNGASILQYFGTDGYLMVWTNGGWLTCSNDVWGQPVAKVTTNTFASIAIYQNFSNRTAAILVNDQVVAQDLPFIANLANCGTFQYDGADGDAWLDDVRIQPTYDTTRHLANSNGVDGADAAELETYGYVARTHYVGGGSGYPGHATIQAALNDWRARDSLYVYSGQYAENVTVSSNVTFSGQSFTNSGNLTIGAGAIVTFENGTVWSNITIGANAQVAFNQALTCSNLFVLGNATVTFGGALSVGSAAVAQGAQVTLNQSTVCGALANTGTVTLADGRVLTLDSATLSGVLLATGASTVTVATVLSVPANGTGHLDFSGGRLLVASAGVDMTGTFSITNSWGTQAMAGLDFADDFELYADNTVVTNLGFRGWGASSSGVLVKAGQGVSNTRAVVLAADSTLSNRVAGAGQPKLWTDYYIRPSWGMAPTGLNTNSYTFLSYVGTNGVLNVWNAGSWTACSSYLDGGEPISALATDSYTRVSVFLNFDTHLAAVFIAGKLVLQQVPFPAGAAISNYSGFQGDSLEGNLALDNIRITAGIPAGLSRAEEIQLNDALMPLGSVFKIR